MKAFFENPLMLIALLGAALPIIIEILFRRRKRQVQLPTIRYLLKSKEQEKVKKQDQILLILRTILLALLGLAISRPLIRAGVNSSGDNRKVIILFDGSASTNQQIGVTTSFGLAVKRASSMVKELPEGSFVTAAVMSDQIEVITDLEADRFLAAGKIEAVRGSLGSLPIVYGLDWVGKYLSDNAEKTRNAEVYIFSDFQKHTWTSSNTDKRLPSAGLAEINKFTNDVFFVDVGGEEKKVNIVVASLLPNEWVLTVGSPVKFVTNVKLIGSDIKSLKNGSISFIVNGEKKDLREFDGSKENYTFEFDYLFTYKGEYIVEVLAEGDEHAIDNQRLYLCHIPEDHQILILDETATAPIEISRRLQLAISPPNQPGQPKFSRFSTKVVHPNNLNDETLANYSGIFVSGFSGMTEPISKKLENYVRDGGAVCFFVGPNISSYEYNNFLYRDGNGLLPRKLGNKKSASGGKAFAIFKGNDHPANAELSSLYKESKVEGNEDFSFNEFFEFAGEENGTDSVLKLNNNGGQAILEKTLGKGRCIIVNSSMGLEWSTMPFTVEYPIMMQELLRFIIGNPDKMVNLVTGDTMTQNVYVSNQHLLLKTPNGKKVRLTPKEGEDKNIMKVSFDRTNQQGLYAFDVMDGVVKRPRFVVNADAAEGDLQRIFESDLKDTMGGSGFRFIPSNISLEDFVSKLNSVTELAIPILWAIAAAILVESFLAAKFGRRRRGAPQK